VRCRRGGSAGGSLGDEKPDVDIDADAKLVDAGTY